MDFDGLAPRLQTGDIFLFNGTTPISAIIDEMTHSRYSHIGMVVRTPGSGGGDGLHLWQSFEPEGGVVVDPLGAFLAKYQATEAGSSCVARLLDVARTAPMLAALDAFMPTVTGRPFPGYSQWLQNYLGGCLGLPCGDASFYCSQLVAATYIAMGLLRPWPFASVYTPGRFSVDAYELQLQLGASLGPEIAVTPPAAA